MSFAGNLRAGRFAVALEITPPQRPLPRVLLRRARLLGDIAQAVNVIQRPGRQSSLDASLFLKSRGIEPVWHLVTRGHSRAEILADIDRAREGGITHVLCIRGDHEAGDLTDTPSLREVTAAVVDRIPGAYVGATLNQYAPDREAVLKNVLPKCRAGAAYVQTQPVFDLETLRAVAEPLRRASPATKIVAMAMPLLSLEAGARIEGRLGVALPPALRSALTLGPDAAWAAFDATIVSLVASPLVDGVAIMTFETDPPPEVGARIVAALRAAGIG
jgi:5,10-methylenetetrahydrofolate reductase